MDSFRFLIKSLTPSDVVTFPSLTYSTKRRDWCRSDTGGYRFNKDAEMVFVSINSQYVRMHKCYSWKRRDQSSLATNSFILTVGSPSFNCSSD